MTTTNKHSGKGSPTEDRIVEISREPVELFKILKFEGLVGSGAEGKLVVAAGHVQVNGKIETQKRKKIVSGDTIEFNGEKMAIRLVSAESDGLAPLDIEVKSAPAQAGTAEIHSNTVTQDQDQDQEQEQEQK